MPKRLGWVLVAGALLLPLPGCGGGEGAVVEGRFEAPPEIVEPTLTVAPGFRYREDEPWTGLTAEGLGEKHGKNARRVLEAGLQVGVVCLGDRLRIYNTGGRWRPMTVALMDGREDPDDENEPLASFRLDLPPKGVVRADMPQLADGRVVRIKLTEPVVSAGEDGVEPVLMDRQIGVPAPGLTSDSAAELGFATVRRYPSGGEDAKGALIGAYARGEIGREALRSAVVAGDDTRVTATRTTSGVTSRAFKNPTSGWRSVVFAERASAFVSHGGNRGQAPSETWWIASISDVLPEAE